MQIAEGLKLSVLYEYSAGVSMQSNCLNVCAKQNELDRNSSCTSSPPVKSINWSSARAPEIKSYVIEVQCIHYLTGSWRGTFSQISWFCWESKKHTNTQTKVQARLTTWHHTEAYDVYVLISSLVSSKPEEMNSFPKMDFNLTFIRTIRKHQVHLISQKLLSLDTKWVD